MDGTRRHEKRAAATNEDSGETARRAFRRANLAYAVPVFPVPFGKVRILNDMKFQ